MVFGTARNRIAGRGTGCLVSEVRNGISRDQPSLPGMRRRLWQSLQPLRQMAGLETLAV